MLMSPLYSFMLKFVQIFPKDITPETVTKWNQKDLNWLPPKDKRPRVSYVKDCSVPGPESDVPIRIYSMEKENPAPAIIYYHGGGFALGSIELFDISCRKLCQITKSTVISVGYRLAPEHPFPAAVIDACAVLEWTAEHAQTLHIDPDNINTCGDSAGGTLALVVPIIVRDRKGPAIAHQIGLYPCTSVPTQDPKASPYLSFQQGANNPVLTSHDLYQFLSLYSPREENWNHPYLVPANSLDLQNLPPALIITAGHCPLRDEGNAYAQRLANAGVYVETKCYGSMAHAFLTFPLPESVSAMKRIGKFIRGKGNTKSSIS